MSCPDCAKRLVVGSKACPFCGWTSVAPKPAVAPSDKAETVELSAQQFSKLEKTINPLAGMNILALQALAGMQLLALVISVACIGVLLYLAVDVFLH